jgi:O-antigen ligase
MFEKNYFHFYGINIKANQFAGGESVPRSTGISRMCLIVYIFLVLRYFLNKNNKNYFLLLLITFFGISTIIYQSRLINSIFLVSNCFFVIFYLKKFFYDKRLIIFCFILPVFLNIGYTVFSQGKYIPSVIGGKYINIIKVSFIREQRVFDDQMSSKDKIFRFSSGRFSDWDKAIKVIKRSPLKGYGAQSDRFFLNGQSVHNSFLYAYLSGGIMGGIAIISIYIYSVLILLNFYFFKGRKDSHHYIMDVCALIMVIILLRSILETSFAVFGIDFLLFTVSLLTLSKAYYTKFD